MLNIINKSLKLNIGYVAILCYMLYYTMLYMLYYEYVSLIWSLNFDDNWYSLEKLNNFLSIVFINFVDIKKIVNSWDLKFSIQFQLNQNLN